MQLRRANSKKISFVVSVCLIAYIVFSAGYHNFEIENVIANTEPEVVWEYVADFSKMRLLNPTILNFKIIADHGHAHDWRYTVEYTERLSHWPYWLNTNTANYIVTKTLPNIKPAFYVIESVHNTCFFKGAYCLRTESNFKFYAIGLDTFCDEKIRYQCPPFLSSVCRRELEFQRKAVMHNLTHIFQKRSIQLQQ